jgi:hypothetical protein
MKKRNLKQGFRAFSHTIIDRLICNTMLSLSAVPNERKENLGLTLLPQARSFGVEATFTIWTTLMMSMSKKNGN